jgi:DNA-binding Lrp family transcriptional regulator
MRARNIFTGYEGVFQPGAAGTYVKKFNKINFYTENEPIVEKHIDAYSDTQLILDVFNKNPKEHRSCPELQEITNLRYKYIASILRQLRDAKMIARHGKGNATTYVLKKYSRYDEKYSLDEMNILDLFKSKPDGKLTFKELESLNLGESHLVHLLRSLKNHGDIKIGGSGYKSYYVLSANAGEDLDLIDTDKKILKLFSEKTRQRLGSEKIQTMLSLSEHAVLKSLRKLVRKKKLDRRKQGSYVFYTVCGLKTSGTAPYDMHESRKQIFKSFGNLNKWLSITQIAEKTGLERTNVRNRVRDMTNKDNQLEKRVFEDRSNSEAFYRRARIRFRRDKIRQ